MATLGVVAILSPLAFTPASIVAATPGTRVPAATPLALVATPGVGLKTSGPVMPRPDEELPASVPDEVCPGDWPSATPVGVALGWLGVRRNGPLAASLPAVLVVTAMPPDDGEVLLEGAVATGAVTVTPDRPLVSLGAVVEVVLAVVV